MMASEVADHRLNAEPSQPEARVKQHMPLKSYVDAVQQDPAEKTNTSTSESRDSNRSDREDYRDRSNSSLQVNGASNGDGPRERVLQVLPTKGQGAASETTEGEDNAVGNELPSSKANGIGASDSKEKMDGVVLDGENNAHKPGIERQESIHEYEAAGLDESPKSPPRYKHRKTPSRSSNEPKTLSVSKDDDEVFDTFVDKSNGGRLISTKEANGNYTANLAQVRIEAKPEKKEDKGLVSGREAGKRWDLTPIRFAPLNVPLRRRLQTLVVLFHSTCIALSVSLFFFLCAIPIFWPLLIPYLIWVMSSNAGTSGTLRYRSNFLRGLPVWSLFASYFPARLHRTAELAPTRKYIFGYHPHGIISHGAFAAFCTEAMGFSQLFPGITNTLLTLDSNFRIPIYRDYALAMGLASVSRESCENLLSKGGTNGEGMGRAITIVVGGARESLDAEPHTLRLVLQRRKGFVKMALRTGADLVPVLAFGENSLYDQFLPAAHPRIHRAQLLVKKALGFTIPLFHARGVFNYDVGLMPYRRPLNVVVGRPILVVRSERPSQEEIDTLHEKYVVELLRLWETWKDDFAKDRKEELRILE